MREWWANVYAVRGRKVHVGCPQCAAFLLDGTKYFAPEAGGMAGPAFRIHVRLKPEGAPRRYASEANRRAWEEKPRQALAFAEVGMQAWLGDDGLIYDPRYL